MEYNCRHMISDGVFKIGLGNLPVVLEYASYDCIPLSGGIKPVVTLYNRAERLLLTEGPDFSVGYESEADGSSAEYTGRISIPSGEVYFRLRFALDDCKFSVCCECLQERGLELVTITFPQLISVCENNPAGRLALTTRGGRLVDPASCAPGSYEHHYNWMLDSFCGCSVMYNRDITAVIRLNSLDDILQSHVIDSTEGKRSALGITFRHRYTIMDKPYYKVNKTNVTQFDAAEETYPVAESFSVHSSSTMEICLYRHYTQNPETGWVFGMKKIFSMLPPKRTGLYKDSFVYKIYLGNPGQPPMTTFNQALNIIKSVHDQTGGAQQICYLVGFQHEGHDSMYPDIFTVNEKSGGEFGLLRLMREAEKHNAIVSFHDNYDDAYRQSPMWDEDDIAVDNTGHLLRGGCWNGAQAYWISLPQYAATKSRERIERTLQTYPIRKTYHLDVLTASVFRLDFRASAPKGKDDDLSARLAVVRQFREKGIDGSSEACGMPFIGEITYFWHMMRVPRPVFEGDKRIPAVPFLIHGKADYAGSFAKGRGILDALLYAAFYSDDVTAATPLKQLTDAYYLIQAPLNRLRDEEAVGYEVFSGYKRITYESGSYVQVNFESGEYEAVIGGHAWVRNGTAFIPAEDGNYIAYVAFEDEVAAPVFELPCGWEGKHTLCRPLCGSGPDINLQHEDGKIIFFLPAGVAHNITATGKTV